MATGALPYGAYEALLDEELNAILSAHPELRSIFGKVDLDEQPRRYATFVGKVLESALALEVDEAKRIALCNHVIELLSTDADASHLRQRKLLAKPKAMLLEVTPPHLLTANLPRPVTSLVETSLFTGSPREPQLAHELFQEMASADGVDILVSFIKWSGLRLLAKGLEELTQRGGHVRVITTSYMGASDAPAVEWLAALPSTEVRVSYDTDRTRLHAKAYYFHRKSGFGTAYIGSANMSQAAMTSGLEWNLKVTAQDMPQIIEKFSAEFETYWNSADFARLDVNDVEVFRSALDRARGRNTVPTVLFELHPRPFQERILDALEAERNIHGNWRNLVVAATGTGKTVIAAFDFKRHFERNGRASKLLFLAHRKEILEQALGTFRNVLRQLDFGELLVGNHEPSRLDRLFCSIDMLNSRKIAETVGAEFYDYIVIDEVHHAPANSYRPVFERFSPKILLGLTATPERMDGGSVVADFGNRFAAEIRLPEALDEKLLCPFHYFGVADSISLASDRFWRNGRYDPDALTEVYTGAHVEASRRVELVLETLMRFEPDLSRVKGVGFCVSVRHAQFMAGECRRRNISAAALTGETNSTERAESLERLRTGELTILFTRDVMNEGLDIPEINTVLFLRPTESVTVFLQQLGRGLRHYPGKDCLTVLDFVGQAHRKYRIDKKLRALLPRNRFHIAREVELEFPHLPSGCSIQLDRIARDYVLDNIRSNLQNLSEQVHEQLETFERDSGLPLSFSNFVRYHEHDPIELLSRKSWSEWVGEVRHVGQTSDPDGMMLRRGLVRIAQTTGPMELRRLRGTASQLKDGNIDAAIAVAADSAMSVHYRVWGKPISQLGMSSTAEAFSRLSRNPAFLADIDSVVDWAESESRVGNQVADLPFSCALELHAQYSADDVKASLGLATADTGGQRGVGLLHQALLKVYVLLITFQKSEREFSPSTMYADYPISRDLLHWESQSNTSLGSPTGQNLVFHKERGYTILVLVRATKRGSVGATPYTYLGDASLVRFNSERPIQIVWKLSHLMPAEIFEENRRGG